MFINLSIDPLSVGMSGMSYLINLSINFIILERCQFNVYQSEYQPLGLNAYQSEYQLSKSRHVSLMFINLSINPFGLMFINLSINPVGWVFSNLCINPHLFLRSHSLFGSGWLLMTFGVLTICYIDYKMCESKFAQKRTTPFTSCTAIQFPQNK